MTSRDIYTNMNFDFKLININKFKYELNNDPLKALSSSLSKSANLSLISFIGQPDERKLIFANCLVNYLTCQQKTEFPNCTDARHSLSYGFRNRQTHEPSIQMWSNPFAIQSHDRNVSLLLMDLQVSREKLNCKAYKDFVDLLLTVSSTIICSTTYELMKEDLKCLEESIDKMSTTSSDYKCQQLIVVINQSNDNNHSVESDIDYLRQLVSLTKLSQQFTDIDCFIIFRSDFNRPENSDISDSNPEFVLRFKNFVFSKLLNLKRISMKTKLSTKETLKSGDLMVFFESCLNSINEFRPKIPPRLNNNNNNSAMLSEAKEFFTKQTEEIRHYLPETELSAKIESYTEKTLNKFKGKNNFERAFRDSITGVCNNLKRLNSMNAPNNNAIGIDLGTSNSCVAVYQTGNDNNKGSVKIILSNVGNTTMPSVVAYKSDGSEVVGEAARESAFANPRNTIFSVKRLIGNKFNDRKVQNDIRLWPFRVVEGSELRPMLRVDQKRETKDVSPEEVSARILRELKQCAETYFTFEVNKAVITVPAYFTDSQKKATREAGKLAGLEVLQIINEPTAAAIAFKLNRSDAGDNRKVLIYDFGGGTFDVAVLLIDRGNIEIKSVAGDMHLGGDDIDNNMVEYCLDSFYETHKIRLSNANQIEDEQRRAIRRLLNFCERNKRFLTTAESITISVDCFYDNRDLLVEMTRKKFEELNKGIFKKTIAIVKEALDNANLRAQDIDDIVLVGGSTKIPKVRQKLSKFFHNKPLNHTINPDEAVAVGAAIQAAILNGGYGSPEFRLLNVAPLSLGIAVIGERFSPIIKRNTKLPTKAEQIYTTTSDYQTMISIFIYEGNGKKITDSNMNLLGKFSVTDIPKDKKGRPRISVSFEVDDEGILHVKATLDFNGLQTSMSITEYSGRLSADDASRLQNDMN